MTLDPHVSCCKLAICRGTFNLRTTPPILKYRRINQLSLDTYMTYDPMKVIIYQLFIWVDFTAES